MGIVNALFESVVACIILQLCAGKRIDENLPDYDQGDYSDYSFSPHDIGSDLDFRTHRGGRRNYFFPSERFLRSRGEPSYDYDDYDSEPSENDVIRKIQNLIASEEQRRGNDVGFYKLLSAQVDAVRKEDADKTGVRVNNKNCLYRLLKRLVHISPLVKRKVRSRSAELMDELEQFEDWARLRRGKRDLKDVGPGPKRVRSSVAKIHPKKVIEDIKNSFEKTPLIFDKASKIISDNSDTDDAIAETSLKASKLSGLRKKWKDHLQPPLMYKVRSDEKFERDESDFDPIANIIATVSSLNVIKRTESPIRNVSVKKINDPVSRTIKDVILDNGALSRKNSTEMGEYLEGDDPSEADEYDSLDEATTRTSEDRSAEESQDAEEPFFDLEEKNQSKPNLARDDDDADSAPDFVIDKIDLHIKKAPSSRIRDSERKLRKDDLLRLRIPVEDENFNAEEPKRVSSKFANLNLFKKRKGEKINI